MNPELANQAFASFAALCGLGLPEVPSGRDSASAENSVTTLHPPSTVDPSQLFSDPSFSSPRGASSGSTCPETLADWDKELADITSQLEALPDRAVGTELEWLAERQKINTILARIQDVTSRLTGSHFALPTLPPGEADVTYTKDLYNASGWALQYLKTADELVRSNLPGPPEGSASANVQQESASQEQRKRRYPPPPRGTFSSPARRPRR